MFTWYEEAALDPFARLAGVVYGLPWSPCWLWNAAVALEDAVYGLYAPIDPD